MRVFGDGLFQLVKTSVHGGQLFKTQARDSCLVVVTGKFILHSGQDPELQIAIALGHVRRARPLKFLGEGAVK